MDYARQRVKWPGPLRVAVGESHWAPDASSHQGRTEEGGTPGVPTLSVSPVEAELDSHINQVLETPTRCLEVVPGISERAAPGQLHGPVH